MSKQAMKKALDALEKVKRQIVHHNKFAVECSHTDAIAELRAALDAPVEPFAYTVYDPAAQSQDLYWESELGDMDGKTVEPLYLAPPDTEGLREELERVKGALETAEALLLSMGMESSDAYQEIITALNTSDSAIAAQGEKA